MTEQAFKTLIKIRDSGLTNMWDSRECMNIAHEWGEDITLGNHLDYVSNFQKYVELYGVS